jgi:cyclophilin family peptidyl-prolyl cis-trans isomerase
VRLIVTLLCLAGLVLGGCGRQDEASGAGGTAAPSSTAEEPGTGAKARGECRPAELPAPRPEGNEPRPREALDPQRRHDVTVQTNCGSFTIRLDLDTAPKAAASFVALARGGFYEDTVFHRIVPGFVIQGGDPMGDGSGGPGYKTVDKPPRDARYTKGVVAMAKAGPEAPGTAGSQFFVVTGDDAGLPPEYAVLGKVTDGLDVVELIGTLGNEAEEPTETVVVEKMAVLSS